MGMEMFLRHPTLSGQRMLRSVRPSICLSRLLILLLIVYVDAVCVLH